MSHTKLSPCHTNCVLTPCSIIISVTGGAKSFDVSEDIRKAIKKGLFKLASTKAGAVWFVSGGTHSGVMQLLGEIMGDRTSKAVDSNIPVSLIGIGLRL